MSRVRSWLAAPLGARLLGVAFAVVGVALLVLGLLAFNSGDGDGTGAAPGTTAPASEPGGSASTSTAVPTATGSPEPTATGGPPPSTAPPGSTGGAPTVPVRAPLTVLNNSTVQGLGDQAAAEARAKGWTVASVGNFAGRIPVSTVYFTPGNAAEERAARQLAVDLPKVARVYPRYEGLPPTPTGVVLVVTRDW